MLWKYRYTIKCVTFVAKHSVSGNQHSFQLEGVKRVFEPSYKSGIIICPSKKINRYNLLLFKIKNFLCLNFKKFGNNENTEKTYAYFNFSNTFINSHFPNKSIINIIMRLYCSSFHNKCLSIVK